MRRAVPATKPAQLGAFCDRRRPGASRMPPNRAPFVAESPFGKARRRTAGTPTAAAGRAYSGATSTVPFSRTRTRPAASRPTTSG